MPSNKVKKDMVKYTIQSEYEKWPECNETHEYTVKQILEEVNRDRSGEWTDYDEYDWLEGLLQMTEYGLVLKKGDVLRCFDIPMEITLLEDVVIKDINDTIKTDQGEYAIYSLNPIEKIVTM